MWWNIVIGLVLSVVSALFYRPPPGPAARTAEDLSIPKASEGSAIYDIAGTAWIEDAHVVWHGDFASWAIYKKGGKK